MVKPLHEALQATRRRRLEPVELLALALKVCRPDLQGSGGPLRSGGTWRLRWALAHAAARRELVAAKRPVGWEPPSIFRSPEVLTESELVEAETELKALQRHAFEMVHPEPR
jgi:hypothetical protein